MKVWNRETFGNITKRKEDLLSKIQELDKAETSSSMSEHLRLDRAKVKDESKRLLLDKKPNGVKSLGSTG